MSDEEGEVSTQEENKFIAETVKAILILDYTKKPFKQSDVSKFLTKKPNRKIWSAVFDAAKAKLKEMGYSLVELKHPGSKTYILTSRLSPLPSAYKLAEESEVADRTLLVLVLTFIFMKEGLVKKVELFNHLQELEIYREGKSEHEYFGDVQKKILVEFVSQLYLEKVVNKEAEEFEIKWGERAHAEVSKWSILNFVCDIGYEGSIKPENLAPHYKTFLEEGKTKSNNDDEEFMMVDE